MHHPLFLVAILILFFRCSIMCKLLCLMYFMSKKLSNFRWKISVMSFQLVLFIVFAACAIDVHTESFMPDMLMIALLGTHLCNSFGMHLFERGVKITTTPSSTTCKTPIYLHTGVENRDLPAACNNSISCPAKETEATTAPSEIHDVVEQNPNASSPSPNTSLAERGQQVKHSASGDATSHGGGSDKSPQVKNTDGGEGTVGSSHVAAATMLNATGKEAPSCEENNGSLLSCSKPDATTNQATVTVHVVAK